MPDGIAQRRRTGRFMLNPADHDVQAGESPMVPLCVDLDDTLINTDILWESAIQLWRRPLVAANAIVALATRGKAALKKILADSLHIDPAALPYNQDVLAHIREQHSAGRKLVLATATHRIVAQRIADHLGIFSEVHATDADINLSGAKKRDLLVSAFGIHGFDYIGDHQKDLPIFASARESLVASSSKSLLEQTAAVSKVSRVFPKKPATAKVIARALRLHQWSKNALLAVPLLSAHLVLSFQAWTSIAAAFFSFGLVASATYLVNDLLDLPSDRRHAKKRFRPLASGQLSIPAGISLGITSSLCGFALALALLPTPFIFYLLVYVVLTLAYSMDLKRRLLVDVLALALLYTLRILAGGAAIGVFVSEWLLMFSLFIFLSLAFLKRAIELQSSENTEKISGRGYSPVDLDTVRSIGVSSGLISVMVLALYINSPAVTALYQAPKLLWLLCPLLIYWIARIWFLAARDEVHHDPVVFALLDWRSYVVAFCGLCILLLATLGPIALRW